MVACKHSFSDFVQVRNLRDGIKEDGKVVTFYVDVVIGAFSIKSVSVHAASGGILMPRRTSIKGSYMKTFNRLIHKAIKEQVDVKNTVGSKH